MALSKILSQNNLFFDYSNCKFKHHHEKVDFNGFIEREFGKALGPNGSQNILMNYGGAVKVNAIKDLKYSAKTVKQGKLVHRNGTEVGRRSVRISEYSQNDDSVDEMATSLDQSELSEDHGMIRGFRERLESESRESSDYGSESDDDENQSSEKSR